MSGGRPHKLTYPQIRKIDEWNAQPRRNKKPSLEQLAHQLGVSKTTINVARRRRFGYAGCPK